MNQEERVQKALARLVADRQAIVSALLAAGSHNLALRTKHDIENIGALLVVEVTEEEKGVDEQALFDAVDDLLYDSQTNGYPDDYANTDHLAALRGVFLGLCTKAEANVEEEVTEEKDKRIKELESSLAQAHRMMLAEEDL